jgi:hypothetical protein
MGKIVPESGGCFVIEPLQGLCKTFKAPFFIASKTPCLRIKLETAEQVC